MKCLAYTTALTLALFCLMDSDKATATSNEAPSQTSAITPSLEPLNSTSSGNAPQIKPDSLKGEGQPSRQEVSEPEPRTNHAKRRYPAYCDAYILNSTPDSWQFEQDIQRCIHGGG